MMFNINKKLILIIFLSQLIIYINSYAKIEIKVTVDNEIITNVDIKKEAEYLKILNPNLIQLNENKILELSKRSLINELVKKKEILKFVNLINEENEFSREYLKNLYIKLDYNNENDFKNDLSLKNSYSIEEIKKKINIELYWNELIYESYNRLIKIDKESLIDKIENIKNEEQKEYFLSEIVFAKKKNEKLEDQLNQITLSINDIGFKNTANIYSISQSSKFGGDIGWVNESSLSQNVSKQLSLLNEGETTNLINIGNNYLILKINKIKINKIKINKEKELEKLIQVETNRQLNKFSRIYFDKSKINYSISEK
jgi:peptidyl-prolyl cis-trans isomerase SurA